MTTCTYIYNAIGRRCNANAYRSTLMLFGQLPVKLTLTLTLFSQLPVKFNKALRRAILTTLVRVYPNPGPISTTPSQVQQKTCTGREMLASACTRYINWFLFASPSTASRRQLLSSCQPDTRPCHDYTQNCNFTEKYDAATGIQTQAQMDHKLAQTLSEF